MQPMKFGDCLNELLQLRGWSAARLAKTIAIDSSYVRRWIRGERTPALNTAYITQIADALHEGLDKDFRKATKDALLKGIEALAGDGEDHADKPLPVYDRLVRLLQQSQVHTLTLNREDRKTQRLSGRPNYVMDFLETTQRHVPSQRSADPAEAIAFAIDPISNVIKGRGNILSAAISMIQEAMNRKEFTTNREIFLTFQSEREYFDGYPELYAHWRNTIVQALREGWNMKQICKLNRNIERSIRLVSQIMDWTNYEGTYELFYFNKYGIFQPPFEIFLVRGKGALLCFAADHHDEIDSALYIHDPESVQIIENYAGQMFYNSEQLIRKLDLEQYFELNSAKDRRPGDHLLCYQDLNFLTVPHHIMENYVRLSIPDEDEAAVHMARITDSYQSFQRDIGQYRMCHIYPKRAFEHLVQTGRHPKNAYFRPNQQDIIAHIKHIIWLLRTYERFEIALVSDNQMDLLNPAEWEIKGDHTIMIGVMPKYDNDTKVELLTISEGTIVRAFQEYYWEVWERINPINRDKDNVIAWLEQLLR